MMIIKENIKSQIDRMLADSFKGQISVNVTEFIKFWEAILIDNEMQKIKIYSPRPYSHIEQNQQEYWFEIYENCDDRLRSGIFDADIYFTKSGTELPVEDFFRSLSITNAVPTGSRLHEIIKKSQECEIRIVYDQNILIEVEQ